jgi:hypothetical protein
VQPQFVISVNFATSIQFHPVQHRRSIGCGSSLVWIGAESSWSQLKSHPHV